MVENFVKYSKIKALGHADSVGVFDNPEHEIVIQEKIDGGNFRFTIHNGIPVFGSRTQQLTSDEGEDDNIAKNFTRTVNYVREQIKGVDLKEFEGFVYFGESCHKHTLEYDWEKIPPFLGFDVWEIATNTFLPYREVLKLMGRLNLSVVPIIKICKAKDIKEWSDNDVPVSVYAPRANPTQQAEGVVFKNYEFVDKFSNFKFAKYVRGEFKEANRGTFGGTPKYEETDAGKIGAKFCTNARIEKHIFKLVDEDVKLEMAMMRYLPKRVYEDIIEEEWKYICLEQKMNVNFRKLNKIVTKRCTSVLNQVITNNAFDKNE